MSFRLVAFVFGIVTLSSNFLPYSVYHLGAVISGTILITLGLAYQFFTEYKSVQDMTAIEEMRAIIQLQDKSLKDNEKRISFMELEFRRVLGMFGDR